MNESDYERWTRIKKQTETVSGFQRVTVKDLLFLIRQADRGIQSGEIVKRVAKLNEYISSQDIGFGRWGESVVDIAIDELKRYKVENERLREALEFYANEDNNLLVDGENTNVSIDAGKIARKALGVEEE